MTSAESARATSTRPPAPRELRAEEGSAPAAVLAWVGATVLLVGALGMAGTIARSQAEAATAADLAALAAADALAVGGASPCAVAQESALRNGARLTGCTIQGEDVVVRAAVPAGVLPEVTATARAGPGPPGDQPARTPSAEP